MKRNLAVAILLLLSVSSFAQSPLDSVKRSTIYYSMENLQLNADTVNLGIYSYLYDSIASLYGGGAIIFKYDTFKMGPRAVSAGRLRARMASSLNTAAYSLSLSDLSANQAKMQISPTASLDTTTALSLSQAPVPLLSVQATPLATSGTFTDSTVVLDSVPMQNQSAYLSPATSALTAYDTVRVSDNFKGTLRSTTDSVYFSIANTVLTSSPLPTYLDFDIVGYDASGSSLNGYSISLSYNTNTFDSAYFTDNLGPGDNGVAGGTTGCCGGSAIYSFSHSFSGGTMNISISPILGSFDAFNTNGNETFDVIGGPGAIAHVTLHISDCATLPQIAIDPASTASYVDGSQVTGISNYGVDTAAPASYNNDGQTMCILPPTVTGISPECIGAGSFDVLTITGSHFGTDTGYVYFTNADTSGGFTVTQKQDIRLWSDGEIDLLIPTFPGVAAGGVFYIQTAAGLDNAADSSTNKISIDYANDNTRPTSHYARFVYLDTSMVFQLDTTLFNTPGVKTTILDVMADMNCQTGVNFQLDTTAPSVANFPSPTDQINLISIQPAGFFTNPTAGALTSLNMRYQSCGNSLPQYNNSSDYQYDVDIEIINAPTNGATWLWSDASYPTYSQLDFASVIAHELGHAAMLNHTLPISRDSGNVMNPYLAPGHYLRNYDNDPNDILGIKHALSLGVTLATAGSGCSYAVQTFPSTGGCPTLNPVSCVTSYPTLGINEVSSAAGTYSAYLYPNPYQGNTIIHIDVSEYTNFTITIYDVVGHLVSQSNISSAVSFDIPLSDFNQSAGLYLIQVADPHSKVTLKLIKL